MLNTAINSGDPSEMDCSICFDTFTDPVRLPCSHIFDRRCITTWLSMRGPNTCPSCRALLFSRPEEEADIADRQRAADVHQAIRNTGLPPYGTSGSDTFGIPSVSVAALQHAVPRAAGYLIFAVDPEGYIEDGPALISCRTLAAHVVAMGTIIPSLSALQGQTFSSEQLGNWRTLVHSLWKMLQAQNNHYFDAMVMPRQLAAALKAKMTGVGQIVDGTGFFGGATDGSSQEVSVAVAVLLSYITCVSRQEADERRRAKEQAIRRRKERDAQRRADREEPKMQSRCGMM